MLKKLRPRSAYDVLALLAFFIAVSTGGAYATHLVVNGSDVVDESLTGADIQGKAATAGSPAVNGTLTGADVKNSSITSYDIALNTIGGGRVIDNSLTGADINESTLGQVPDADKLDGLDSAALIGPRAYGRVNPGSCSETSPFVCSVFEGKGVSDVRRPSEGVYCITVPGAHWPNAALSATVNWNGTRSPEGNASAMSFISTPTCPSGQFGVITQRQPATTVAAVDGGSTPVAGNAVVANDIGFSFVVP